MILHFVDLNLGNRSFIEIRTFDNSFYKIIDKATLWKKNNYTFDVLANQLEISLYVGYDDDNVSFNLSKVQLGNLSTANSGFRKLLSLCGSDDRVAYDNPAVGRLNGNCTAWIGPNHKMVTARHCWDDRYEDYDWVLEFDVPPSTNQSDPQQPTDHTKRFTQLTKVAEGPNITLVNDDWLVFEAVNIWTQKTAYEEQGECFEIRDNWVSGSQLQVIGFGEDDGADAWTSQKGEGPEKSSYDNYVQLSNGVDFTDMAIQTFNTNSAPYYFNSTTVDATLSKTSTENEAIKGREIVFNNGKSNLVFEVNNIKVDENAIDFVEIEDTTVTKSNEEAISLFETESFSLTDKSNFSFDVNYTLIDKENLEEQFGFEYQLVDVNTNMAIGVLEKIETSKLNAEEENSVSYTINTEGIGNKQVKLKLVVAKEVADNVAIISTFSTKSDLAKASNKVISFDEALSITDYALSQNYPNPFNPSTIIKYQIPNDGMVSLRIYDITGQEVKTLVNQAQSRGRYEVNFDASNLSSGVYFYKLTSGSFTKTMKMLLLK